jgi:hypothetical protein
MAGNFHRPLQRAHLERLDRPFRQQQAQDQLPAQKGDQADQAAAQEAEQQARSQRWAYRSAQTDTPMEPFQATAAVPSQPTEAQPPIGAQMPPPFKPEDLLRTTGSTSENTSTNSLGAPVRLTADMQAESNPGEWMRYA